MLTILLLCFAFWLGMFFGYVFASLLRMTALRPDDGRVPGGYRATTDVKARGPLLNPRLMRRPKR